MLVWYGIWGANNPRSEVATKAGGDSSKVFSFCCQFLFCLLVLTCLEKLFRSHMEGKNLPFPHGKHNSNGLATNDSSGLKMTWRTNPAMTDEYFETKNVDEYVDKEKMLHMPIVLNFFVSGIVAITIPGISLVFAARVRLKLK